MAHGAIAFDAFNAGASNTTGADLSWTHTPVGTPRGVLVLCHQGDNVSTDQIGAVTYGGVTMTEVTGSPHAKGTGEQAIVYAYFLGASIPTGAQTVLVDNQGSTEKRCTSYTVTASDDTSVEDTDASINSDSVQNPSGTLVTTVETWIAAVVVVGGDATTDVHGGASYTVTVESDFGTQIGNQIRITSNASAGNVTYDWTTTAADDAVAIAVAIREGVASATTPRIIGGGLCAKGLCN